MADKLLPPARAGDLPQVGVVLQGRDLLRGKARDPRLQHLQQGLRLIAPLHRLERPQHKAHHRFGVHPGGLGDKAGDVPPLQRRVQAAVIPLWAAADDGEVPVAPALLHDKASDSGRRELRLLIGVPGLKDGDALVVRGCQPLPWGEELGLHQLEVLILKAGGACQHHRRRHRHAVLLGGGGEPAAGAVHQGEQARPGLVQAIGAQSHHHLLRPAENLGQDSQLLGSKALKGIHSHQASLKKRAGLQRLGQAGQVVPRVQVGGFYQSLICTVQQGDLLQFFAQAPPAQAPGGIQQLLGRDAAQLHLVDCGEHPLGDAPVFRRRAVDLQPVLTLFHRYGHEDAPPPLAEPAPHGPALPAEDSLCQAGKAVHRDGIGPHGSRQVEHGLLRFKGILLRHQQDSAALPLAAVGQHAAQVFRFSGPSPAQYKLQQ